MFKDVAIAVALLTLWSAEEEIAQACTAIQDPKTSEVILSNEMLRVRFHCPGPGKFGVFPKGYTSYSVDLNVSKAEFAKQRSGAWRQMARVPYFTAFSYRSGWGRDWLAYVIPQKVQVSQDKDQAKAVFTDTRFDFDQCRWDFTFEFVLKAGVQWIDVTYTAKPQKQSRLLLMWGPRLYAGDGSFGSAKDEALFAGIEYLGPNDRSSANPALAPDAQIWFAPTPQKLSIPLMCVVKDGGMVGLMWNPMQEWYAGETCPSAVFASPNWIEDKPNHLMGLYVPSIGKFAAENSFRAHTPVLVEGGQTVSISCRIFAALGKHVTDAVDLYLRATGGLPRPAEKPMDYDSALRMLVNALLTDAWDAEKQGWPWHFGGDVSNVGQSLTGLLMIESGRLLKLEEAVKRGREVIARHQDRPLEMALRVGDIKTGLEREIAKATDLMNRQKPDGSWTYYLDPIQESGLMGLNAPPEPGVIAPENYKSQGLTGGHTAALLSYVRITADERAWKAALKGLTHMNSYSIPFVYMNHECPPSPSLHGSCVGLRANLIAYEITGDRKYLDHAVYWAKTGLPFIYLWSLTAREVNSGYIHAVKQLYLDGSQIYKNTTRNPMLYGGLYGYGSSQFSHHWYGILVHWIPLVYARDIMELSRYDHTLLWERIADGILTSALWQTFDQPPYAGYLPDAFSLDTWVPSGPAFAPGFILGALMDVHYDRHTSPLTEIVRDGDLRCHITSSVRPLNVKLASGTLVFSLTDRSWPFVRAIIAGIDKPAEVFADGKPLAKENVLEARDECWSRGPLSTILIKLKSQDQPRQVQIRFK